VRLIWTIAGCISVGLGLIGAVLPLLPTVPFMLLAAFCFARGSERFHRWLVEHKQFGPAIAAWRDHGAVPRRGKIAALIAIVVTFGISVAMGLPVWVLAVQAVVLGCVLAFVLTRPDGPEA
jgi:uncharacterized membrane protein YbaN (DUF454 family)